MSASESLQVLGLKADATREEIRQAYLDLVRVWHPDRFQADSRLRKIAEEHLREVNAAYGFLKNEPKSQDWAAEANSPPNTQSSRNTASAEEAHHAQNAPRTAPWFRSRFHRQSYQPNWRKAIYGTVLGALCVALVFAFVHVLNLLRTPVLAADALLARGLKPGILAPARSIDPLADLRQAAHSMTEWARSEEIDVSKPAPSATEPSTIPGGRQQSIRRSGVAPATRPGAEANAIAEESARNGAELVSVADSSGAGELRLVNNTNLEAILKLMKNRWLSRAIYITPHGTATVHSITIGVYELHVELGTGLDATHLRFQENRFSPKPLGRFEFLEVTSEKGRAGNYYEVAVNAR